MILFVIFSILAAASAERLVSVPLGKLDVVAGVGQLPFKYQTLEPTDIIASVNASKWANAMIPFIPTGTHQIPPVDPYVKDRVPPVDVQNEYASGKIYVKNLVARGLKDIVLNNLEMRNKNSRTDVNLFIPALNADIEYSAALNAGFLPLTYDGHATLIMDGITAQVATGTVMKKYLGTPVFQVDTIELALQVRNLELSVSEEVWNAVGDHATVLFEDVLKQSATILAKTIMSDVNKVLMLAPAQLITQFLLGTQ